jgi:hypothetical protein
MEFIIMYPKTTEATNELDTIMNEHVNRKMVLSFESVLVVGEA